MQSLINQMLAERDKLQGQIDSLNGAIGLLDTREPQAKKPDEKARTPYRYGNSPVKAPKGQRTKVLADAAVAIIQKHGPLKSEQLRKELVRAGVWNQRSKTSPASYLLISKRFKQDDSGFWNISGTAV